MRRLAVPGRERAVILIMTVIVISVLLVLAYALVSASGINLHLARNLREATEIDSGALSALHYAMALLALDADESDWDALNEKWAGKELSAAINGRTYGLDIADENRKLNVNRAARKPADPTRELDLREVLKRLVTNCGGDEHDYEAIVRRVGGSSGDRPPTASGGGPLHFAQELRSAPGLSRGLFVEGWDRASLLEVVATHPARININTARREVLEALWNDPMLTEKILQRRKGRPFRSDDEIDAFLRDADVELYGTESSRLLTAASDFFAVSVRLPDANRNRRLVALVRRNADAVRVLRMRVMELEVKP